MPQNQSQLILLHKHCTYTQDTVFLWDLKVNLSSSALFCFLTRVSCSIIQLYSAYFSNKKPHPLINFQWKMSEKQIIVYVAFLRSLQYLRCGTLLRMRTSTIRVSPLSFCTSTLYFAIGSRVWIIEGYGYSRSECMYVQAL